MTAKYLRQVLTVFFLLLIGSQAWSAGYLYKTVLLRAAPGKLLTLIDFLKKDMEKHADYGLDKPYLLRHSQGDQWDLLMIIPVESLETYYNHENAAKRQSSFSFDKPYGDSFYEYISYHEDMFVTGPPLETFKKNFATFDYYHVEMFIALPGKQTELLKQRRMENVYLEGIARNPNLIFTRVAGSKWDIFTIGCYRDIKHFAESADIPADLEEKAALQAGFKGANFIGSYLRELIAEHHDTLANAVR